MDPQMGGFDLGPGYGALDAIYQVKHVGAEDENSLLRLEGNRKVR